MTDERPELNTTEMRQGNNRKMNLRALIIGLIIVVIGFIIAMIYNQAVSPDTTTTTDGGEHIEQTTPAEQLENLPTPAPVNPEPVAPAPTPAPAN